MKILFAGTPEFAVMPLIALHEEHEVVAVFTQPDRPSGRGKKLTPPAVKVAAQERGIPVYQPQTLADQVERIRELEVDLMVVVAYGMLLPQAILDLPRIACINIHASLLPRWRGAAPIQRAIEAGDPTTGVCIMQMELGLDTGPVYQALETPIDPLDTSASLHDKLAKLGAQGIIETLAKLAKDPTIEPLEQDHQLANYAKKINKAEANIDWSQSAAAIDQKIRGFNPWPICQTHLNGERIRVWQAKPTRDEASGAAGEIVKITDDSVVVACGQGSLALEVLQRAGSKPMPSREFRNGFALAVGQVLGDTAQAAS